MTTDHPAVLVTFWVLFFTLLAYAAFILAGIVWVLA
jgi:hypothetical protein